MELYTTGQVAAVLGISARRVRAIAKSRKARHVGRAWIFTAADLAAMRGRRDGRPRRSSSKEEATAS
jgi:hypothetical protein